MADAAAGRVRHGGFVDTAATDQFDAACYGISRAEAMMDPQQRLLLEHGHTSLLASLIGRSEGESWEWSDVEGRLTGVFVGIMAFEFGYLLSSAPAGVYTATGWEAAIASGRLSYCLGLQGPCISYETACSTALVATHEAWRAVQLAECTRAVAAESI